MKKSLLIIVLFQIIVFLLPAQVSVTGLLTENQVNPVGIDENQPQFSWQIVSEKRNTLQTAYEIKVSEGKNPVWSSGKILSDQSVFIPYAGKPLQSDLLYTWQVKVYDNYGKSSQWSNPATFRTAFLDKSNWKAKWIEPGYEEDRVMRPSPLMRKQFEITKKIQSAVAYITAHGMYEASINGKRVGDAYFTPGWTSYKKRLQYQVYDVTSHLKNGDNAIGVMLGNGWYRGIIGFANNINYYGSDIALLFQLNVVYTDGSRESIVSDGTWKSSTGSVRYAEIYNGEIIDAQKEKAGWTLAGFDDNAWDPVKVADYSMDVLIATCNEPIKKHEVFSPVRIFTTPAGEKVIDFGQNLVGWVQMTVSGKAGDRITLSHAEVLDKKGNFYTENLREAKARDVFILKGGVTEVFEPHFTWHGFRYVKVEGFPAEIKASDFKAFAMYSNMQVTGSFTTSDTLINKLQHNIQWGQKGNFLDVPTDCPQRDERLGWTGDAQAFSRTATFNMNVHNFFIKWLKDVEADQVEGRIPFVVPNVIGRDAVNSAGWADVATIGPWNMYLAYGDKRLLQRQYPSMKAYVESIRKIADRDLWNSGFHFGDWLFYRPNDDNEGRSAVTDKYLIAQCFYAHSVSILAKTAAVIGNKEDEEMYNKLLKDIKEAFLKEYLTPNGRLVSGTQTAYVLALNFDMLPENLREQAVLRLTDNIRSYNNHLTTGFLGTPYLCHVLSRFGQSSKAYELLFQKSYPSWLYPVTMGATTIWERWDGQKPDSTFQNPGMNSFNHYAYGAVGDWMYRVAAGIDTYHDYPGYKHICIKPVIGGNFTSVQASLDTYYGKISNTWKKESGRIMMHTEIPPNTRADIYIPATSADKVTEGGRTLSMVKDITIKGTENGYVVIQSGSGRFDFECLQ